MASPMGVYTQASMEREYRWIFALTIPAFVLMALVARLVALAILIHFILLSTDRFNWLEGPRLKMDSAAEVEQVVPGPRSMVG